MQGALKAYHVWPNKEAIARWKSEGFDPPRSDLVLKPCYGPRRPWPKNAEAKASEFSARTDEIDTSWVDAIPDDELKGMFQQ